MTNESWPDPTPEMLETPEFEAVWQAIRTWDIAVPEAYYGYCGATGNHVRAILDALGPSTNLGFLGWHDAAGEWHSGETGPGEDVAGANRVRFEAAVVALVAEFIGSLTGLRPPLERALFPPDQEPALNRLCDGLIQLVRECGP
jgi:hypothetical protein